MDTSELQGKTFKSVQRGTYCDGDALWFEEMDGTKYVYFHSQDCCESVYIDDIVGDLNDLVGEPLLASREAQGVTGPKKNEYDEEYQWTFYLFGTRKGHVTVKWYGASNGYYSVDVSLDKVD